MKGVQGAPGVFEMTWAEDGRATWQYGEPIVEREPHVVWRRIGGDAIFLEPLLIGPDMFSRKCQRLQVRSVFMNCLERAR